MREFVYFSKKARTSGVFRDLMSAGRLDIACHTIIMSFFVSRARRENVKLHLFFYGRPDPPKHIELVIGREETEQRGLSVSKKDIAGLLKRILFKYKKGRKIEAFPNCFIEKKGFSDFVEELNEQGRAVYLLSPKGEGIREVEIRENPVFIFGDHEGIPKEELKKIKKTVKPVSLGRIEYFTSQVVAVVHNELDIRGIE